MLEFLQFVISKRTESTFSLHFGRISDKKVTYKVNLKKYTLFNKILDQNFEKKFQRITFSVWL